MKQINSINNRGKTIKRSHRTRIIDKFSLPLHGLSFDEFYCMTGAVELANLIKRAEKFCQGGF